MAKKPRPMPNKKVTPEDEDRLRAFLQVPRKVVEDAIKARKRTKRRK